AVQPNESRGRSSHRSRKRARLGRVIDVPLLAVVDVLLPLARRVGALGVRRRSIPRKGPPRLTQRPIESEARKGSSTLGGVHGAARGTHRGTDTGGTPDGAFACGGAGDATSRDA